MGKYKYLSWDEFRAICYADACNWSHDGYNSDEVTAEDILNEYPDDYFDSDADEWDDTHSSFTPDDFARQTIAYLADMEV